MWKDYDQYTGVNKKAFYDTKFGKDKWKSFMPRLSQVRKLKRDLFYRRQGQTFHHSTGGSLELGAEGRWGGERHESRQAFREAECGEISMEGNTGPTLDSHRLITFAARHNKQDELVEELFRNYFLEAKTICDKEVLLAAAEKASARPLPV
jgi:hypothetical protein